jgi:hypothetical protein
MKIFFLSTEYTENAYFSRVNSKLDKAICH